MNSSVPNSEEEVLAACRQALRLAPADHPPTLPTSKELLGAPEWYPFEREAWAIGESVRRAFAQHPRLKKNASLISKVAEVATCRNLRRGRQSFIMAMGFVSACPFAASLLASLNDPDVDGQVVHTLLKMRANGCARSMGHLLHSDKVWIRRLAKKYIERYPA